MKFGELKLLFYREAQKAKMEAPKNTAKFISVAYSKVLKTISYFFKDNAVATQKRINELPITDHMKEKLTILLKNHAPKTSKIEKTEAKNAARIEGLKINLSGLLGVGSKKINELVRLGLTDINHLQQKKFYDVLGNDTKLMLEHKPLRKIPYECIKKIELRLISFTMALVRLVGSFRRRCAYSKDIDILIKSNDPAVLDHYLNYLTAEFDGKVFVYSKGNDKMSLIIQPFESEPKIKYKLDIFRAAENAYYPNLLYSTGSKEYNIRTRAKAKKMGYVLNQNGLFKKKGETLVRINSSGDNEEKILSYINMPYILPENRI